MARSRGGITFNILVLSTRTILAMIVSASSWMNDVDAANRASVYYNLPPILSSCLTPLSSSATRRWATELSHSKTLKNVSSFCNEGGLICDESIETPSAQLHAFTTYRLVKTKEDLNLHDDNMFFKESLLSLGSPIKLPMQEPHIPTRAFLPPLLEPQLFNHSTPVFSRVLQSFGFRVGSPLANSMQETIQICNTPPGSSETKACVATFEDMLDFAKSSIGTADIEVLASTALPHEQLVTVMDVHEVTCDGERVAVVCHNAMFPFQVFYCHHIEGTKVYKVTLQTTLNEMTKISAVASCHPLDTSSQLLPSSHTNSHHKEVLCHWNYGDNIIWIPIEKIGLQLSNPPQIGKF